MDRPDPPATRGRLAALRPRVAHRAPRLRLPTDDELLELLASPRTASTRRTRCRSPSPGRRCRARASSATFFEYHWSNRATWTPESWELGLASSTERRRGHRHAGGPRRRFAELSDRRHRVVAGPAVPGSAAMARDAGRGPVFAFDGLGARSAETEAFLDNAPVEWRVAHLATRRTGWDAGAARRPARQAALPDER